MSHKGLILDNIAIGQGRAPLLTIDTSVAPGEVLTLMGPSGSGKSTLIAAISGFLGSTFTLAGRITLEGRDITNLPPEHRRTGVLFQDPLLFPHFSVIENIIYALPPGGSRAGRRDKALDLLGAVGMADCATVDPATLSGGQQARVALVRVLAAGPSALLLDEPFSKLDLALRTSVRDLVFAEGRRRSLPILLVTHDPADAESASGRIITLTRPGIAPA